MSFSTTTQSWTKKETEDRALFRDALNNFEGEGVKTRFVQEAIKNGNPPKFVLLQLLKTSAEKLAADIDNQLKKMNEDDREMGISEDIFADLRLDMFQNNIQNQSKEDNLVTLTLLFQKLSQ